MPRFPSLVEFGACVVVVSRMVNGRGIVESSAGWRCLCRGAPLRLPASCPLRQCSLNRILLPRCNGVRLYSAGQSVHLRHFLVLGVGCLCRRCVSPRVVWFVRLPGHPATNITPFLFSFPLTRWVCFSAKTRTVCLCWFSSDWLVFLRQASHQRHRLFSFLLAGCARGVDLHNPDLTSPPHRMRHSNSNFHIKVSVVH